VQAEVPPPGRQPPHVGPVSSFQRADTGRDTPSAVTGLRPHVDVGVAELSPGRLELARLVELEDGVAVGPAAVYQASGIRETPPSPEPNIEGVQRVLPTQYFAGTVA